MEILNLNFYSKPIDVRHEDEMIFVNWNQFVDIAQIDLVDHQPPLVGEHWVSLSYLMNNFHRFHSAGNIRHRLVSSDFFPYIVKELGVMRNLIPQLVLGSKEMQHGFVMHDGRAYILQRNIRMMCGTWNNSLKIPDDVPRIPVAIVPKIEPGCFDTSILCDWLIETNSIPYILSENSENMGPFALRSSMYRG